MTHIGLNARQEAFARKLAEGASQRAAYIAAGYDGRGESADEAASRLSRNVKVEARVAELQAKAAKRNEITIDLILQELEAARIGALEEGQYAAAVAASMGRAKIAGLIIDRTQIDGSVRKPSRTPTADRKLSLEEWRQKFQPKFDQTGHGDNDA